MAQKKKGERGGVGQTADVRRQNIEGIGFKPSQGELVTHKLAERQASRSTSTPGVIPDEIMDEPANLPGDLTEWAAEAGQEEDFLEEARG